MENMTGAEIRQAIAAVKNTLDKDSIKQDLDFQIAADHNMRRKIKMIDAAMELYEYLHGNGAKPETAASVAFNPNEGLDKTNIYYIFKELYRGMPWEIRRDYLIKPTALTLLLFDLLDKLFPNPIVTHGKIMMQGFVNLWTLPVDRPGISAEENKRKRDDYFAKMHRYEEKLTDLYISLSGYFAELEDPDKNPLAKKVNETHKRTKKIAEKVCGKEEASCYIVQQKALAIWNEYRNSIEVKRKYCAKHHRITYADVFAHCKKALVEIGIKTPVAFSKQVLAAKKNQLRMKG